MGTGDENEYDEDDHHKDDGDDNDNENCDVPNDGNKWWWPMMNSDADWCVAGSVDDNDDRGDNDEDDDIDEKTNNVTSNLE